MAAPSSGKAVVAALFGNLIIAAFKYFAAWMSGSSSMLAEGHHSLADTTNQVLLLIGLKRSKAPPSERYHFGTGKAQFFWSFIVAVVLFGVAGGLAIKGGFQKVFHPEPIVNVGWTYLAIGVGIFFDGIALRLAYQALRHKMAAEGETSLLRAFRECTDATIITVLMEDAMALIGLALAGAGIAVAKATGWYALDGYVSILIGAMLMVFALVLALEVKSLLLGEALPSRVVMKIRAAVQSEPKVRSVVDVRTMVLGAQETLIGLEVVFEPAATVADLESVIDAIERRIAAIVPGARCYIEAESLKRPLNATPEPA
ncbi:MAG TPA: cation diffusion facilitator family transporter [Thermoanaerobaculia bacterium]|nr:cation diffusion facilitator family transporter [Thermoanaerobaculia bacterium]